VPATLAEATTPANYFRLLRLFDSPTQHHAEPLLATLLQSGATVNDTDMLTGLSLIHFAVRSGAAGVGDDSKAASIVTSLIRKGADVNIRCSRTDMTPLQYAAFFGCALTAQVR
jgi:CAP-Gly domain-containing linker protein 3/4